MASDDARVIVMRRRCMRTLSSWPRTMAPRLRAQLCDYERDAYSLLQDSSLHFGTLLRAAQEASWGYCKDFFQHRSSASTSGRPRPWLVCRQWYKCSRPPSCALRITAALCRGFCTRVALNAPHICSIAARKFTRSSFLCHLWRSRCFECFANYRFSG